MKILFPFSKTEEISSRENVLEIIPDYRSSYIFIVPSPFFIPGKYSFAVGIKFLMLSLRIEYTKGNRS